MVTIIYSRNTNWAHLHRRAWEAIRVEGIAIIEPIRGLSTTIIEDPSTSKCWCTILALSPLWKARDPSCWWVYFRRKEWGVGNGWGLSFTTANSWSWDVPRGSSVQFAPCQFIITISVAFEAGWHEIYMMVLNIRLSCRQKTGWASECFAIDAPHIIRSHADGVLCPHVCCLTPLNFFRQIPEDDFHSWCHDHS